MTLGLVVGSYFVFNRPANRQTEITRDSEPTLTIVVKKLLRHITSYSEQSCSIQCLIKLCCYITCPTINKYYYYYYIQSYCTNVLSCKGQFCSGSPVNSSIWYRVSARTGSKCMTDPYHHSGGHTLENLPSVTPHWIALPITNHLLAHNLNILFLPYLCQVGLRQVKLESQHNFYPLNSFSILQYEALIYISD